MNSLNRWLLLCFSASSVFISACDAAPDLSTAFAGEIVNVGLLSSSSTPPLGIGVAPILGVPGPTPASYPAASVGASGASGSMSLYGGQWVIPLPVGPGAAIANVSCDMLLNATTTVTMELIGRNGLPVVTTTAGPAAGLAVRTWLVPTTPYLVEDGGQAAIRLSFRNATTSAWTSGAEQIPMQGCAVNATATASISHTRFQHVIPAESVLQGGIQPMVNWPRLFIGPSSDFYYPLDDVESSWTITGVRIYMTQMPLGGPFYELATENIGAQGDLGFVAIAGTSTVTPGMVVDLPIPPGLSPSAPLHVHIKTDSNSTSSLGALRMTYLASY